MLWDLFAKLGERLQQQEQTELRFRTAVLMTLTKIEQQLIWILTGQVAQNQKLEIWHADKFEKDVKEMDQRICESSHRLGLEAVKFVYAERETAAPPKRGRKGSKALS